MKKHNFKKILSIMLLWMLVFNIVPITENKAYASEINLQKQFTETYINPMHKDMAIDLKSSSSSVIGRSTQDAIVFNTIEEASNYVRKEMVKRSDIITFSINTPYYDGIAKEIFNGAVKYSNEFNSNEGDYLEDHFSGYSCSFSYGSTSSINFTYNMKYLTTYDEELQVNAEVKNVLDQLNVYNSDEYTKIKAVHDYIVKNIKYDYTYSKYSAYNAIIEHDVVCQGFSSLTYKMLKDLGVGVRCVVGNNSKHEWNIARIGGLWYNLDNTWDENISSENQISYKYLLKNMTDFTDHTRDDEYSTSSFNTEYPMDGNSYVYDPNSPSEVKVTGVTLNMTSKNVVPNEQVSLVATIAPENAVNKAITWSSSDETVATVDQNGKVTALKEGTATITATSNDTGVKATCLITVANETIKVAGVTLDKTTLNLSKDETSSLVATVAPENAVNKAITWSSSDETVAIVDQNGKVKALKEGTATITATSNDTGVNATCLITVSSTNVEVTDVTLNKTTLNLYKGDTSTLNAAVAPINATNKDVTWTSSNEQVATVKDGVVTAIGIGNATITAKAGDKTSICTVTVAEKQVLNGWVKNNNQWYYYINGVMQKGWKNINGSWYYLKSSGVMASGWQQVDGVWYYLNSWGSMKSGWLQDGSTWYYLKSSGAMASGWEKVNGTWYYLNSWGSMKTGWLQDGSTWYYLNASGAISTGWQKVNGEWYFFYNGGNMATNVTIVGWRIGSNGVARK